MPIKFLFSVFFGCVLWTQSRADVPEYYLWQRNWSAEVSQAASAAGRPLAIFAAELSAGRTERAAIPEKQRQNPAVTAVFRVRLDALNPEGFRRLAGEIRKAGFHRIQIDADVPERRLAKYAGLLRDLKAELKTEITEFSITALPCHLRRSEFRLAAEQSDYYVLQLHGIETPKNLSEPYKLLDPETARNAIRQARKLKHPFKPALPAYAYALYFSAVDGKFITLSAEGRPPETGKGFIARIAAPDFAMLGSLLRENTDLTFVWFRLPVAGDKLCLDRTTLDALEHGELPSPGIETELRRTGKNALELWVTPRSRLQLEALELALDWKNSAGEFDLAPGVENRSAIRTFAMLPTHLAVPFPGCGVPVRAATFFVEETNQPIVKEIILP